MPQQLKHAWFDAAVCVAVVGAFAILLPSAGPRAAFSAFALFALTALGPAFYRRKSPGQVVTDERDRAILLTSVRVSVAAFWLFFVAACMGLWTFYTYYRHADLIPAEVLPNVVVLGAIVFVLSKSLATIVQYRRSS